MNRYRAIAWTLASAVLAAGCSSTVAGAGRPTGKGLVDGAGTRVTFEITTEVDPGSDDLDAVVTAVSAQVRDVDGAFVTREDDVIVVTAPGDARQPIADAVHPPVVTIRPVAETHPRVLADGDRPTVVDRQPADPSDDAWRDEVIPALSGLDCPEAGLADDPDLPLVACDTEGENTYLLEAAVVSGTGVASATSMFDTSTGGSLVNITLTDQASDAWATYTTANVHELAGIVLDGIVLSAPEIASPITGGEISIAGGFDADQASELAGQITVASLGLEFAVGDSVILD